MSEPVGGPHTPEEREYLSLLRRAGGDWADKDLSAPLVLWTEAGDTFGPIAHETEGCTISLTFPEIAGMAHATSFLTGFGDPLVVIPKSWTILTTRAALDALQQTSSFRVERR